jgi:hypothetical protein
MVASAPVSVRHAAISGRRAATDLHDIGRPKQRERANLVFPAKSLQAVYRKKPLAP